MNEVVARPVAYSYVRFSTAKQQLGDSLRRQVEGAEDYCRDHGLDLHPVSYRDLGVSAFKQKNLESGALAAFINAVKVGKIEQGSFLIIEQFDRLSRADVDVALRLLLNLVDSGVKIVTLADNMVWDKQTVKEFDKLILAIVFMSRANNESMYKSKRVADAWKKKKEGAASWTSGQGRIVTSECPRWLRASTTRTSFIVLDDKVESIKKVFEMRIGGFGIVAIVNRANKERWAVPGKAPVRKAGEDESSYKTRAGQAMTWHTSNVGRLLKNRALLGEYQPHINDPGSEYRRIPVGDPIPQYYPPVIDEATFLRAQAKADRSGRFPGRRDASLKNWLQGLLRCTCGQSFVRKNKDSKAQPGYARYYCTARNRGVTDCPSASAKELETAVLTVVSVVAPQYFQGTARMDELRVRSDLLEVDVSAARQMRDRYVEAIGSTTLPVAALIKKLDECEKALSEREQIMVDVRAEIADLSGDFDNVFENIVKAVNDVGSLEARAALREELSRVIEKAIVHQDEGFLEIFLRGAKGGIRQPLDIDATVARQEHHPDPNVIDSAEPFQPYGDCEAGRGQPEWPSGVAAVLRRDE